MNANDTATDEVIAQSLGVERTKRRVLRKLIKLLRAANLDIMAQINGANITSYQARRINELSNGIREILRAIYIEAGSEFEKELEALVRSEIIASNKILDDVVGISWSAAPSVNRAYTAAYARPFQGKLLKQHYKDLPESLAKLVDQQLRIGYNNGDTQNQINARVQKILKGRQSNFNRAVVNTAIAHFQAFAHRSVYQANAGALKGVKLTATLDTRTSDICQERDGRVYDLDRAPNLPFHYNERSVYSPVLKDASQQRFASLLDSETRSSLDGQVSGKINFKDWVGRQSFKRQSDALGRNRALLHRDGGLPIESLYGNSRLLTVAELSKKFPTEYAKAFGG